jgi:hypothetical protein
MNFRKAGALLSFLHSYQYRVKAAIVSDGINPRPAQRIVPGFPNRPAPLAPNELVGLSTAGDTNVEPAPIAGGLPSSAGGGSREFGSKSARVQNLTSARTAFAPSPRRGNTRRGTERCAPLLLG